MSSEKAEGDVRGECDACGIAFPYADLRFCPACGAGRGAAWTVLAAVPAALVAGLAVLVGRAAPDLLSTAWSTTPADGIVHEWRQLVVPSAVVALPWLYVAVAGWTAVVARPGRSVASAVAAIAVGTGVVVGTTALAGALAGAARSGEDLLIVAAVATGGGLAAWGLGSRAARATGTSRLAEWTAGSPIARLAAAAVLVHLAVLAGVVLYALAIAAIWVACVVTIAILGVRFVWHIVFGEPAERIVVRKPTWFGLGKDREEEYIGGELVRTATEETGFFGGKRKTHRDAAGNVIGVDEHKESWLTGEKHIEHKSAEGKKLGETRARSSIFGDHYLETTNASGEVVAEVRAKKSIFGEHYTETRNAAGEVIGRARVDEPLVGERRVVIEGETAGDRLRDDEKEDK